MTYTKINQEIDIQIETSFIPQLSNEFDRMFTYEYNVRLLNNTDFPFQVIKRSWKIVDTLEETLKITRPGFGKTNQPVDLYQDEMKGYSSKIVFTGSMASMIGFFTVENLLTGERHKVRTPKINFESPYGLN